MSDTRLIFHLSDEDDDRDVGTPEAPAFGLGAQPVQDPSKSEWAEPGSLDCERQGALDAFGSLGESEAAARDPYGQGQPTIEEDRYVQHRALGRAGDALFLRALPRRALAIGALAALALVVLVVMIVVHSPRPASVASVPVPTYAAGAARSESALGAPVPVGGESVRRQARVARSEPRPAHTHRAHRKARAPVTRRSEPATTTTTTARSVQASTPAPAPDVARSVFAPQSAVHSTSASYIEFGFER